MKTLTAMCVAIALTAGCANNVMWQKDGVSQAEFSREANGCMFQAKAASAPQWGDPYGVNAAFRQQDLYELCMQANGYAKR
jgi:hypothetical protein